MLKILGLLHGSGAAALESVQMQADQVQEVYMGNVLSAGLGQAPARQAALVNFMNCLSLDV
jgi:acetyl-CoA acetyltransferase